MTVENDFRWKWEELAGRSVLTVAPVEMVDDKRWIAFIDDVSSAFPDAKALFIADVQKIEDKVSLEGFKGIVDSFKRQGIESAVIAVITSDKVHSMTARMFQSLADTSGFDLQIEVFSSDDSARDWMENRIGRD